MKSYGCLFAMFLAQCLCVCAIAKSVDFKKEVERAITRSKVDKDGLALQIDSDEARLNYAHNADKLMIPASLTKIFTAAAVTEGFPLGHQFETHLLSAATLRGYSLDGDLYLQGGGDAGFVSESMWVLVNDFLRTGVKVIEGNIVVDDNRFDKVRFDETRDQDRADRAYDSPIGAMTFNWSAVNVYVRPADRAGKPAIIYADPETDFFRIENEVKTVAKGKTKLDVRTLGLKDGKEGVRVSGQIGVSEAERVFYKPVDNPALWAGENLRAFLKRRGVDVKGKVLLGSTPLTARKLATYKSKPVGDLIGAMLKFSNNYIAEILTKNLGVEISGAPGTMDKGVRAVTTYLKKIGINGEHFVFHNPSGLSRKNRARCIDFVKVLRRMRKDFRAFPEYLTGFPIAGVDGTLKSRMTNGPTFGQVRAKTGHLSGISGLAGYAGGTSGRIYEFAFMFNGSEKQNWQAKELFDEILKILLHADKSLEVNAST